MMGMGYQTNIDKNQVRKWVNHFQTEGWKGLRRNAQGKRHWYGQAENSPLLRQERNAHHFPQPSKQGFYSFETPNEKWVTDITYLMFSGQKLYISVMKDLYNNEIVAYQISRRNDLKLVVDTLKKAKKKRNVKGVLLHSDQGFQYTSRLYHTYSKSQYVEKRKLLGQCLYGKFL